MISTFELNLVSILILLGAGFLTGFINTLAGGGSLLSIPALIFVGMPSPMANATNRVGIVLQTVVSTRRFFREGVLDVREAVTTAIPALLGAAIGAVAAAELDARIFDIALGIILLVMLATLFFDPRAMLVEREKRLAPVVRIPIFFAIGLYGGFVQAGVGLLIMAVMIHLMGHELIKTNAQKVVIILLQSALSLAIFTVYGMVQWIAGLVLALGSMLGAAVGVHFAMKRGAKAVRWVVVVAVVLSALRLFDVI
ncbi:MAG: sulfite exporter TauE/SafE family protein [Spirochaetaceae bacterium]